MKLKVTYNDATEVEVDIERNPRAQVELERKSGGTFPDCLRKDGSAVFEMVYFGAWAALHYSKREPDTFDDWLNKISDVSPVKEEDDEAGADPTRPDQSPES